VSSLRPAQRLAVKLESITDLSATESEALHALPMRVDDIAADQDIVREGDRPSECCLLLEGFACRFKFTEAGKRQIFAFHTPGDIPDLQSLHLKRMDHTLGTVTPCKVAFIPHHALRALMREHSQLGDALWRDTLVDAAIFREWMVGIGRRSAKASVAHLLCELFTRLKAIGMAQDGAVPLPLTQAEVGDALGLSTVHVNRTLQELRAQDLFTWENRVLKVLDWQRLAKEGEFDAAYLHLDSGHPR